MKLDRLPVEGIFVGNRHRAIVPEAVERLVESIQKIGLQVPISVRFRPDDDDDPVIMADLVAGAHRLEAVKRLGWKMVDVALHDGDETDARLWEIAENLHRAELTALQRDEHVAEWVRLTDIKGGQVAQVSQKGGRGKEGGLSAASRELGIERTDARRATKVDSLSPEAKQAAVDAGLDDNRSALLKAAKEPSKEAQIAALRRHQAEQEDAGRRRANAETDKIVKERRLAAVADYIMARMDVTEAHTLGEMLAGICEPLSRALMREAA